MDGRRATFVLSLDCELLWGSHYAGGVEKFPYLRNGYRHYYDELLRLFGKYDISATFAFVGAIALSPEEFRQKTETARDAGYQNWLNELSERIRRHPPLFWHDPSVIEKVLAAPQKHELASHSLTHFRFNESRFSEESAETELSGSHQVLSRYGVPVKTFIFPENRIHFLEAFQKSPFTVYRARDAFWYSRLPFQRLFHFLDQALPIAPRAVEVKMDHFGSLCIPGSLLMFAYDGVRKWIPDGVRYWKIRRGIDRAISERKIFHLWFHPWNLGSSPRMARVLEKVLAYVDEKRNEGVLDVATMGGLTDGLNG